MGQLMKSDPTDLMGTQGQEDLAKHMAGAQEGPQALDARMKAAGQGGLAGMLQGQGLGTPIYSFQRGGTVPGPMGQPQLAMVHGGEQITNPMLDQPTFQRMPGMEQRGPWSTFRPGLDIGTQPEPMPGMGQARVATPGLAQGPQPGIDMRRGGFVPPGRGGVPRPSPMGPAAAIRSRFGLGRQRMRQSPFRPGQRRGPFGRPTPGGTRPGFGVGRPMGPGRMQRPGFQRRGLGQDMQPRPNAWQRPVARGPGKPWTVTNPGGYGNRLF